MSSDVAITNAVQLLVKCTAQLYGMLPFSFEKNAFKLSRGWLWYSRMIAPVLLVLYACSYSTMLHHHCLAFLGLSHHLIVAQFAFNFAALITLYLQVLLNPTTLLRVLNDIMKNMEALLKYTYTPGQTASILVGRRLLFKTFFLDFMLHLLMYAEYMWVQRDMGPEYLLSFSLNSVGVLQLVAAANIVQCALLWGIFLYRLINERIRHTIGSVLQMDDNVAYWNGACTEKRFIFNHICRQLNILRGQHYRLMESIRNIVHFYNIPLALMMCHQFLIIISEVICYTGNPYTTSRRAPSFQEVQLAMFDQQLASVLLRFNVHVAQAMGFLPLKYIGPLKSFREDARCTAWSYGVAVTLIIVYPVVYALLIPNMPYPELTLVYYLVWLQCVFYYVVVVLAYARLLPARKVLCNVFNSAVSIYRQLTGGHWPKQMSRTDRNILKMCFKIAFIDALSCGLLLFYFGQFYYRDPVSRICWVLNITAVWQIAVLNNVCISVVYFGVCLYDLLNGSIRQHTRCIRQASRKGLNSELSKLACESVQEISRIHHQITTNVKHFVRVVDHPLACMLLVYFVMIVTELFYAYTSFIQDIRSGGDVKVEKYISSIVLASFEAFQFYFIVSSCSEISEQAQKTGILINEFLQTDAGPAVERCIETFTIELLHQDFKIDNYGMYNIDYTLMFSMIASITSYLIMLVQFQLAEV